MTWSPEEISILAGAAVFAAGVLALYAIRLRYLLAQARRRLDAVMLNLENTTTELKRLSGQDPLTGVANRRLFDEILEKEWARALRSHHPLALIMIDIDRFKQHNDTYGHQAGDECLRQVAATLKAAVHRPADLVARYGGEEFVIVLPAVDIAGAMSVAERMRLDVQKIKLEHVNNPIGADVTVSLGVSIVVPDRQSSALELIAAADEALYRAKAVGRNQVIVADVLESTSETVEL